MILHVSLMFLKTDSVFLMTVGGHKHSARLPWAFNGKLNNKKKIKMIETKPKYTKDACQLFLQVKESMNLCRPCAT